TASSLLLRASPHRDQVAAGAEEEDALGDGGGGQGHLPEPVPGEKLEGGPGLEHEDFALLAGEVDLAVGRHRRRGEARPALPQALLVEPAAGFRVVDAQDPVVPAVVEQAAVD